MVEFKLTINDPKAKKSYKKVVAEPESSVFRGKKINDTIKDVFGFSGYEFVITGGSDKQGFPMRKDLESSSRKKLLMTSGHCVKTKRKGMRKRKTVVGNTISATISQINLKISKYGNKKVEDILGIKKEETTEEKLAEKPTEEAVEQKEPTKEEKESKEIPEKQSVS